MSRFERFLLLPLAAGVAFVAAVVLIAKLVAVFPASGPNCPGKDPSWIGWCSEAPDAW